MLTFIGIVAAIALIYGWTAFRTHAIEAALRELDEQLPTELAKVMQDEGHVYLAKALNDAELLARLQERFISLDIDDTDEATEVDTQPDWRDK